MKNFNEYAEKAIKRYGLTGYNNLAREIGVTKCVMSNFRHGKLTPSDETFLKIVELAGLPKEEALIDLNLWRSKNNPELNKIWQRLAKMVGCLLTFSVCASFAAKPCISAPLTPIDVATDNSSTRILCDKFTYEN